jgi:photosystem II stability/assembly factor-like uncharacterized protein
VPQPSATATVAASATPTPTSDLDDTSPNPDPSYRPLAASEPLTGFASFSVSFVSTNTGWFLGERTCGAETCGALLQTRDAGRTFTRLTPPPARVAGVRFADLHEGWAFGNGTNGRLYAFGVWRTHDGGRSWRRVLDRPVQSLEVGAGSVWAVVLDESGTGPQLWRGDSRSNTLRYVEQIPNRAATVVVGHGTAYVVAQSIAGPIATTLFAVTPSRTRQRRNPCTSDEARSLEVAVGRPQHLVAICSGEPSAGNQFKRAYASSDDGRTWQRRPDPPGLGYAGGADSVAATTTSAFMTGFRNQINKEVGAGSWRAVLDNDEGLGFTDVGFTDDTHGVALGAEPKSGAWLTADAGEHWRRLVFR